MTPREWDRFKPLFDRARELEPAERARFIERLRLDNEETARKLSELIEANDRTNSLNTSIRVPDLADDRAHERCFAVGELVLNRFRILRFLGRGGMGEVWEAADLHLGRVALKTIRTDVLASEHGLARFRREVQLARRITHTGVCRIHDLFVIPARPGHSAMSFLTMEYLPGVTLAERIKSDGPLPLADAESVALQVCSAVQSIHDTGIIHRDLKASNIMLVADPAVPGQIRAVVMDLGLARETESEAGMGSDLTRANAVLGTPEYMAPEQFTGQAVTPAADVYALGVVLYEIATGNRPFRAATPMGTAAMRGRRPPAASSLRPGLPRRWDEAIDKCLEFDPERRFASASAVATGLRNRLPRRQLMIRCAAAAILVGAGVVGFSRSTLIHWPGSLNGVSKGITAAQTRTLVVLPFENLGANPANQSFCDGLQETIASMLSHAEKLRDSILVVPSSEVRRNQIKTITDARRLFGAKLALTGSVQDVPDGLQIALNLTDAQSLRQQDSRLLVVKRDEMAGLQQRLATEIDSLLGAGQAVVSQARLGETTRNSEAYRLYVQAQGALQSGNTDLAIEDLRKAMASDPEFTTAEAKLAEAYLLKYEQSKDPAWLARADAAENSAGRNGQTPETRYVQAMIWQFTGETDKAVASFRQILQSDPANVDVWDRLANTFEAAGRTKEAEETFQTAVRLRPGYWPIYNDMGTFYLDQHDYPKAEQSLLTGITIAPDVPRLHSNLGALYFNSSRWDDAAREFEKSVALKPYALGYSNLGTVRFFQGKYPEAARQFEEATRLQPANYINWGNLGDARWQLAGQREAARAAFEKAALLASQRLVFNPGDVEVRYSYALYLAKTEHFAQAKSEIETAITRSPEDMNVRFFAARVYAVTGDPRRALEALTKARALGYGAQEIEQEPDFNLLRQDPHYREIQSARK